MVLERCWYDARLEARTMLERREKHADAGTMRLCAMLVGFGLSGFAAGFCLASLVLLLVCFGLAGYAAGLLWLQ